ncbi:hypothetical protein J6590_041509 [Homalodisca vitripennis]|nr:hypothetical protein J6590_041509 [Homalodisca vitripennis]
MRGYGDVTPLQFPAKSRRYIDLGLAKPTFVKSAFHLPVTALGEFSCSQVDCNLPTQLALQIDSFNGYSPESASTVMRGYGDVTPIQFPAKSRRYIDLGLAKPTFVKSAFHLPVTALGEFSCSHVDCNLPTQLELQIDSFNVYSPKSAATVMRGYGDVTPLQFPAKSRRYIDLGLAKPTFVKSAFHLPVTALGEFSCSHVDCNLPTQLELQIDSFNGYSPESASTVMRGYGDVTPLQFPAKSRRYIDLGLAKPTFVKSAFHLPVTALGEFSCSHVDCNLPTQLELQIDSFNGYSPESASTVMRGYGDVTPLQFPAKSRRYIDLGLAKPTFVKSAFHLPVTVTPTCTRSRLWESSVPLM